MPKFGLLFGACSGFLFGCGSSEGGNLYGHAVSGGGGNSAVHATGGFGGIDSSHSGGTGGRVGTGGFETGGIGAGGFFGGAGNAGTGGDGAGGVGAGGFAGSGGGVATGGIVGTGGGSLYAVGAAADCNGPPCNTETGSACCTAVSSSTGMQTVYASCSAPQAMCAFPFAAAHCDGPEDCVPGAVCCGSAATLPGLFTELACRLASDCAAAGKSIMCHPKSPVCPSGSSCNATLSLPASYGACG